MRAKLLIVGTTLAVGLLAVTPGAYAGGTEMWRGQTSQGLPMDLTLETAAGKTVIHSWDFHLNVLCHKDGRLLTFGVSYTGYDVVVVNGKFGFSNPFDPSFSFAWKGTIGGSEAHGSTKGSMPAFTVRYGGQVCTSGTPTWDAAPAGLVQAPPAAPVSVRILVVRHHDGTVSRTVTIASG